MANNAHVLIKLGDVELSEVSISDLGRNEHRVLEVQLDPEVLTRLLVEPVAAEIMQRLRDRWAGR